MQPLLDSFNNVDFPRVRTNHPPELIFLCGGSVDCEKNFRPKLEKELINRGCKVVLAEKAMNWSGGQSFSKDLLELEKYFAALVSIIPLVCESYGSVAELGAFINDEAIKNKLYIIIQEQFYSGANSSSFIRNGPIKNYEDFTGRKAYSISDNKPEDNIKDVCDEIIKCNPSTSKCDFSKGYFQILLLIDIINALVVSDYKEIKKAFFAVLEIAQNSLEDKNQNILLNEMLFVLESLELVIKRTMGSKEYYLVKKDKFYLEFRYKENPYNSNIKTVKSKILNYLFSNKEQPNKIKIINEEKEKGRIPWLAKTHLQEDEIVDILKKAPLFYKIYNIPKKNGGSRTIAQPTGKLKELQKIKLKELENSFEVHDCANAYIKNKNGILSNAEAHKKNNFFYKFDFKNFFPSIKANDFNQALEKKGFTLSDRIDFIKTFFRFDKDISKNKTKTIYYKFKNEDFNKNENPDLLKLMIEDYKNEFQLSIGAPSSPFISNIMMYDFDEKTHLWATSQGLTYSRYADDITFSSEQKKDIDSIKNRLVEIVSSLEYPKLEINEAKSRFCSFKNNVKITGLNITPDHKVSLGRKKKKEIRAMIHSFKNRKLPLEQKKYLKGWLSHCKAVESSFFESMKKKYTSETIKKILHS